MDAEGLEQLVRRRYSPNAEIRIAARQQIDGLSDADLLKLLSNHARPNRRSARLMGRRALTPVLYTAFAVGIVGALTRQPLKCLLVYASIFILTSVLFTAGTFLSARRRQRTSERPFTRLSGSIASFLADRTDPRFLPHLLAGLEEDAILFERTRDATELLPSSFLFPRVGRGPSPAVTRVSHEIVQQRRLYRKLLKAMLRQIGSDAPPELSAEQKRALLIPLQMPEEDVELTLSLLAYFEQWGETPAVPTVKRLIRERHWYVGSDQVTAAASRCLERIESRLLQQKQSRILLRPTPARDPTPPHALLRPAVDSPDSPSEQLLRPEPSSEKRG